MKLWLNAVFHCEEFSVRGWILILFKDQLAESERQKTKASFREENSAHLSICEEMLF